jgi:hypothetical protein
MPPPYSKLIFISNNVKDIDIIQSRLVGDVTSIVIDSKELDQSIEQKIQALGDLNLTHLALMFDNTKSYAPFIEYTAEQLNTVKDRKSSAVPETLIEVRPLNMPIDTGGQEYIDDMSDAITIDNRPASPVTRQGYTPDNLEATYIMPNPEYIYVDIYDKNQLQIPDSNNNYKFFSSGFIALINKIKQNNPQLNNLDIISCNINGHTQFTQVGLTVRYHNGIIGGDNWTLSAGNINTIGLYFTSTIVDYKYKLGGIAPPLVGGCYEITIPDHLYWLMTYTNNGGAAPNLSSNFCLGANIDMTGYGFPSESIGKVSAVSTEWFIGTFDGNGYTITIDTVVNNFNGLFGTFGGLLGATPYNATLQNVNVVYKQPSYTLTPPVGGSNLSFGFLIARHQGGQCTNNTVSFNTSNNPITVVVNNNIIGAYLTSVGGLVGIMSSFSLSTLQPAVTNCSIVASVPVTIQVYSPRGCYVGGVIGGAEIFPAPASNLGIFGTTANFSSLTLQAVRINLTTGSGVADELRIGGFLGYMSSILGTDTLYIKNNSFTCNTLTMNSNLPGGLTTTTPLITMYTGGFIGFIDRIVSVDTNNITIAIFNCTHTLYRPYASSNIARASSSTNFHEIKNMNIDIGDNIYNISNIGASNIYTIGNIMGSADSSTALPISIQNIVYRSNNTICNIINTGLGIIVTPYVGGFGFVSAQTFTLAINIINVTYYSNSFTLTSDVLNSNLNFGGLIGTIINSVCSISGCNITVNNISVVRTGITSAYLGASTINVGGLVGAGRAAIGSSICSIGNISVLSDVNANSFIGGIIGILLPPQTTPQGVSYIIQNNTFNIGIISITLTASIAFRRTMLFGGFIGNIDVGSTGINSTLSRTIQNNTINIQKIDINITRSVAPGGAGIVIPYAIGGIFGNIFGAGTYPNSLNPMLVNNLTANLGSITVNGPNIENDIATSVLIGSCQHANFTISNCILQATSLIVNCTHSIITGVALVAGYGGFSGNILVTRGIFNSSQIRIGYLSIILKAMSNSFVGLLSARPSGTLFFANNNTINIGPNAYIEVSQGLTPPPIYPKLVGLLFGIATLAFYNTNIVVNNKITIQDPLTMTGGDAGTYFGVNNFFAPGGTVTNLSNNVYLKNDNYLLAFNTINLVNGGFTQSVIADGTSYQLFPAQITIKTPTGYNLRYSQFTLIFFFEEIVPQPVITCCTANVCDANPQNANFDSSTAIQSQAGQQLVSAVNDFYAGAARGQIRPNAPPIFKTYGQMMEWKQRQNRR